jgi:hypothetical protein
MRSLRGRLVREGRYPSKGKFSGVNGDNFIDPSALAPGVNLHREAMLEAYRLVEIAPRAYQILVKGIFGFDLPDDLIGISISGIELSWDVRSPAARGACRVFWPAWRDSFPKPSCARMDEQAATLRAEFGRGEWAKLYKKHDELVRFEAVFNRSAASRRLRHAIRLGSVDDFASDLEALAGRPYERLVHAQENLVCEPTRDLAWVAGEFADCGRGHKIEPILRAFLHGEAFHHVGGRHERELKRLKERRHVRLVSRGRWRPAGALHRALRRHHYACSVGAG